jgi:outer membrane protein assembly factor BamB
MGRHKFALFCQLSILFLSLSLLPIPYTSEGNPQTMSDDVANVVIRTISWSMFRHDVAHSGFVKALAPNLNNTLWTFTTGGPVDSSPSIVDGRVYIGSDEGALYCLDQFTGELIWDYRTFMEQPSSPAVVDGRVYVGSSYKDKGYVHALDAVAGAVLWRFVTDGPIGSSPTVVDNRVYVGSNDTYIYGLDAINGSLIWAYKTGASSNPLQ